MADQNNRNKKRQEESRKEMDRDVDEKGGESSRDVDDMGNLNDDREE